MGANVRTSRLSAVALALYLGTGCRTTGVRPRAPDPEAAARGAVEAQPNAVAPRLSLIAELGRAGRRQDALDEAEAAFARFPDSGPVREALAETQWAAGLQEEGCHTLRLLVRQSASRVRLASWRIRMGRTAEGLLLLDQAGPLGGADLQRAAESYLDALRPEKAIGLLKQPAAAARAADLRATLGLAQLQAGDYAGAAGSLNPLAEAVTAEPTVRYYAGVALRLGDDPRALPQAEAHLRSSAALAPGEALFHYETGLAHAQLRDWKGARASLELAAAKDPERPEIQRDLARACERTGDVVAAALARGRYLLLLDDGAGAARILRAAYGAHPESEALCLALSEAEHAAGRYAPALAVLRSRQDRRDSTLDPAAAWAEFRLLRALQRLPEARRTVEVLAQAVGETPELLEEKADILERLSQYADAEALLRRLQQREPQNPYRAYRLGYALAIWYQDTRRDALAEAELRKALAVRPENRDANYALGMVLERNARASEAIPYLRRALDSDPTHRDALRVIARAYAQVGRPSAAARTQALLRRLRTLDDERARVRVPVEQGRASPQSRWAVVRFHLAHGELAEATRQLELLTHTFPNDRAAHALLARLYAHGRRFQRQFEERDVARGVRP